MGLFFIAFVNYKRARSISLLIKTGSGWKNNIWTIFRNLFPTELKLEFDTTVHPWRRINIILFRRSWNDRGFFLILLLGEFVGESSKSDTLKMFARLSSNQKVWGAVGSVIVTGTIFKVSSNVVSSKFWLIHSCTLVHFPRFVPHLSLSSVSSNQHQMFVIFSSQNQPGRVLFVLPNCHDRFGREIARRCHRTLQGGEGICQMVGKRQGRETRQPSSPHPRATGTNEELSANYAGIPRLQSGLGPRPIDRRTSVIDPFFQKSLFLRVW